MDVITGEFRDLSSCNGMSLSRSGSFGFIAGRRAYGLIDLDRPQEILKKVQRRSKYDVVVVQFSFMKETLVAVSSNDRIELVDCHESSEFATEHTLKGHTRTVTDLSWHRQQTNLLASVSIDNFIYVWDTNDPRTPAVTLSAVTGASQVCWERTSGKYLATAHEGEIKLWDIRKATTPVIYINAHYSKIFSLDFSPHRADQMVSSSADNTVKLWDISHPRLPENTIKLPKAPVWKVRYTPFGDGLVTLVLNTMVRRENNLMLWNTHNLMSPVHTFYGHTDMVLEFGWRNIDTTKGRNDFQLVTWSKDTTMKLWPIGGNLKTMCGEDEAEIQDPNMIKCGDYGVRVSEGDVDEMNSMPRPHSNNSSEEDSGFVNSRTDVIASSASTEFDTKSGAPTPDLDSTLLVDEEEISTSTTIEESSSLTAASETAASAAAQARANLPSNLKQEFSLINFGERIFPENIDLNARFCILRAETTKHTIYLDVKFPLTYPNKVAPIFSFMTGTTLDQNRGFHLLKKLRLVAQKQVNRNLFCMDLCLRQFEQDIVRMYREEQEEITSSDFTSTIGTGGFQDCNVPFPRSSGARFCGTGQLVCFGWSYTVKFASIANPVLSSRILKTPRALSAVSSAQLSGSTPPQFVQMKQRGPRVRFSRTKSRISSTGSSFSEDINRGRTISESDPRGISETEESRGTVTIYDVLPLWPFSSALAQRYKVLGDDVELICRYNAKVALSEGYNDIAKTWALAAASCAIDCRPSTEINERRWDPYQQPWTVHPMGRPLLLSLVDHYSKFDIQTTAMLCCVFSYPSCQINRNFPSLPGKTLLSSLSLTSTSNTLHPPIVNRKKNSKSECSVCDDPDVEVLRHIPESHSLEDLPQSSWSDNRFVPETSTPHNCPKKDCHRFTLDQHQRNIYDAYVKAYAELLSRLGLLNKSTEVGKCLSITARKNDPEKQNLGVIKVEQNCTTCDTKLSATSQICQKCNKRPTCSMCNLPIRGLTSICFNCGHGGHSDHMSRWFETHNECPTGCGCPCPLMVT